MKKLANTEGNPPSLNRQMEAAAESDPKSLLKQFKVTKVAPEFLKRGDETITSNNNAWIVLGTDRPGSRASGYGPFCTEANAIDICVGRDGKYLEGKKKEYVDNNFTQDSARIYISEITNIDRNFNLVDGSVGESKAQSAIGMKADQIRIMARGGIKLVTKVPGDYHDGSNVLMAQGIDLIAGNNDTGLQAMVKGDNLKKCLKTIVDDIDKTGNMLSNFMVYQMAFNAVITGHVHPAPPILTTPSVEVISGGIINALQMLDELVKSIQQKVNLVSTTTTYLEPVPGSQYILSELNRTN